MTHTQTRTSFSFTLSALALALTTLTAAPTSAAVFKADFNGDGLEDMVVGVPRKDVNGRSNAGAVDIIYGRSPAQGRMVPSPHKQFHQDTPGVIDVNGAEADEYFGWAVAVGDFDADGYDDLAVGAPNDYVGGLGDTGSVNVLYGASNGLQATGSQRLSPQLVTASNVQHPNSAFGEALAAGDFNRDGYTDLAVGAPKSDLLGGINSAGGVAIFFGGPDGFIQTPSSDPTRVRWLTQGQQGIPGRARADNYFGATLLAKDLTRDGCDDLIVGSPFEDINGATDAGAVTVLYCSPGREFPYGNAYIIDTGIEVGDGFGYSLAVGDFNHDAFRDLAIGHPREDVRAGNQGMVTVLYGSAVGIINNARRETWTQESPGVPGDSENKDNFGAALAAADFDDDGFDDLAISIPRESVERLFRSDIKEIGRVVVLHGTSQGLTIKSQRISSWERDSLGVDGPRGSYDHFGAALGIGDFNADNIADLIVGVSGEDIHMTDGTVRNNAGWVHVLYGTNHGLATFPELGRQSFHERSNPSLPIPAEAYNYFGSVLP